MVFSFVAVVFTSAAFLILPFIKLYTKGVNDTEYILPTFALLSVITYAVFCLRAPYITAVQAAGKYKETKFGAFVEAGLNLGISLVCVFHFGLIGVTLGTLAANIFRTVQYAYYISNHLLKERSISKFWIRFLWLVGNVIMIGLLIWVLPKFNIENWGFWILSGLYYFAISVIVIVVTSLLFYKNDLKNSLVILKNMFKRKKKG